MNAKDEAVRLLAALLYGYFGPVSFRVSPKREVVEARAERFDELPPPPKAIMGQPYKIEYIDKGKRRGCFASA